MSEIFSSGAFWLAASIAAFAGGQALQQRFKSPILNPILIASILVGVLLTLTNTSLEVYNQSGAMLSFCLMPATVALSVPIYRQLDLLKKNAIPILAGAFVGSVTSLVSVTLLCKAFGITDEILYSLLPKSVTTPIGVALSELMGGLPAVTTIAIAVTGIGGAIFLPPFLKLLRITDPVGIGLSMGTAAHAVGTSRAIELGETEGAMSGLAISIAGIITAIIVTILNILL